uniref:Uncharacterized protein n=1 Tax=Arundo donax TaxID=35708 RepID=A0A0A9B734_ARUDO
MMQSNMQVYLSIDKQVCPCSMQIFCMCETEISKSYTITIICVLMFSACKSLCSQLSLLLIVEFYLLVLTLYVIVLFF